MILKCHLLILIIKKVKKWTILYFASGNPRNWKFQNQSMIQSFRFLDQNLFYIRYDRVVDDDIVIRHDKILLLVPGLAVLQDYNNDWRPKIDNNIRAHSRQLQKQYHYKFRLM